MAQKPIKRTKGIAFVVGGYEGTEVRAIIQNLGQMTKAARKLGGTGKGTLDHEMKVRMKTLLRQIMVPSIQARTPVGKPTPYWPGGKLRKSVKAAGTASRPKIVVGKFTYRGVKRWYVWPVSRGRKYGAPPRVDERPKNPFIGHGVAAAWDDWEAALQKFADEFSQRLFDEFGGRGYA